MRRLPSIIVLLSTALGLLAQSPHGEAFKMDCIACHTSDSWEIPAATWNFDREALAGLPPDSLRFNHDETAFPLEGGHAGTDCRLCHEALVFTATPTECISCHTDLHNMTVGNDCARCHSVEHWLVDNITDLHQDEGFPLLGAHAQISCDECHTGASELFFNRIGNECINCHMADFLATTEPNHLTAGYSMACMDCHDINAFDWSAENILHDFFPLERGHDIDCRACHTDGTFSAIPTDCFSCHQTDFEATTNPDHQASNFSTDCTACHTLDLDWMPAEYRQHDNDYFPIYSGNHANEWNQCTECHTTPGNFALFSCIDCHEHNDQNDLADEHSDVNDYQFLSTACLECHPNGD